MPFYCITLMNHFPFKLTNLNSKNFTLVIIFILLYYRSKALKNESYLNFTLVNFEGLTTKSRSSAQHEIKDEDIIIKKVSIKNLNIEFKKSLKKLNLGIKILFKKF